MKHIFKTVNGTKIYTEVNCDFEKCSVIILNPGWKFGNNTEKRTYHVQGIKKKTNKKEPIFLELANSDIIEELLLLPIDTLIAQAI